MPFDLTDADIRADVLLLGQMSPVLQVEIIAPDGTSITAGAGGEETVGDAFRVLRVVPADVLAPPAGAAGPWPVVLTVDDGELKNWLARLRKQLSQSERGAQVFKQILTAIDTHGVRYTVSVQARSALRMTAEISQQSRLLGHPGRLEVTLTDSGAPLAGQAAVQAQVTSPTGTATTVTLSETGPGVSGRPDWAAIALINGCSPGLPPTARSFNREAGRPIWDGPQPSPLRRCYWQRLGTGPVSNGVRGDGSAGRRSARPCRHGRRRGCRG